MTSREVPRSPVLSSLFWPQSDLLLLSLFFHFSWTCSLFFIRDSILSLLFSLHSFFPQLLFLFLKIHSFYFIFKIWPCHAACRILVHRPEIELGPGKWKMPSSKHWTIREFPTITYRVRAYYVSGTAFGDSKRTCLLPGGSLLSGAAMSSILVSQCVSTLSNWECIPGILNWGVFWAHV